MRFDRLNISPIVAISVFGFIIPFAIWIRLAKSGQILHDITDLGLLFALVFAALILFLTVAAVLCRIRDKRLLKRRGEQTVSEFVADFEIDAERESARLLFPLLQSFTSFNKMIALRPDDVIEEEPLFVPSEDLAEELEALLNKYDICGALDQNAEAALYGARTIGELVRAFAVLLKSQRESSVE